MSDIMSSDANKAMGQSKNDISEAMKLAVNSDETSKPPKNLSDMPIDVVGLIIRRSGYKERLILRKVCKSIRELVDKQKPALTRLKIYCEQDIILCQYNNHYVAYVSPSWNRDSFRRPELLNTVITIITEAEFEKVAFNDLAFTLKNPKLELGEFSFDSKENFVAFDDKFQTNMQTILKSNNHQLFVEECEINIPNPINDISILPYLKPGVLEKITILDDEHGPGWIYSGETMEQIALLEQWKQAKKLELRSGFHELLIQHVTHFKNIKIYERILRRDSLNKIRNCILEHENPQYCSIWFRFCDFPTSSRPVLSYYTIPDSEYHVEMKISHCHVKIMKNKKKKAF